MGGARLQLPTQTALQLRGKEYWQLTNKVGKPVYCLRQATFSASRSRDRMEIIPVV